MAVIPPPRLAEPSAKCSAGHRNHRPLPAPARPLLSQPSMPAQSPPDRLLPAEREGLHTATLGPDIRSWNCRGASLTWAPGYHYCGPPSRVLLPTCAIPCARQQMLAGLFFGSVYEI